MLGNHSCRRTPFVLDGTGDTADGTVDQVGGDATVLRNFDGLTIVSAPDDAGSGWLGVAPSRPPSARARAASRLMSGALSAASSMTDPPTLCSSVAPAVRSGGSRVGGEGSNWSPSTDMHALRTSTDKLREIELVYVAADAKVCFGLIGNNAKRFCRTRGCKVKAHRKSRFGMSGARGGWFIPAKTPLNGGVTAFVKPFLDANKITEDTASLLKFMEKRTTADWIQFIGVCHEEWNDLEAQSLLLDNIQETGGDDDEDEMDEDDEEDDGEGYDLCEGNLKLDNPPPDFVWDNGLDGISLKSALAQGSPKNTTEALEELSAAFGNLEGMIVESRRGSRQDAMDVLTHLGLSVNDLVAAIDRINKRGRRWVSQIGRIEELREEVGRDDVTLVEVVLGLGKAMMAGGPPDELTGTVEDLTKTIDAVDLDLVRNCTLLNSKIQALERQQATGPSTAGLTMSTPIFDDAGNQVSTLGRVMQG